MRALLVLAALAAPTALTGCRTDAAQPEEAPQADGLNHRLAFTEARPAAEMTVLRVLGQVVTPPERGWSLAPPVPARVATWQVAVGDRVAAGAPLATLISAELGDLTAEIEAQARVVEQRGRIVRKLKASVDAGFRDVTALSEAELARDEARASLERLRRQRAARDGDLRAEADRWTWTAPTAGVVTAIEAAPGATCGVEIPCLALVTDDGLRVQVDVSEALVARLGDTTPRARWQPTGATEPQPLVFARRAAAFDARSRTLRMLFEGADLVPGASGFVELSVPPPAGAVRLPRLAVVDVQGEATVFVSDPERPRPVAVKLVGRQGEDALVTGIPPGQQVVARGAFALKSALAFE